MIPNALIVAIDAAAAMAAFAVVLRLLMRPRLVRGAAWGLLLSVGALILAWAGFNIVEWTGVFLKADIAEDFFEPLLPIVWLFLFIIVPEQEDRRRLRRSYDRLAALHRLAVDLTPRHDPQTIMEEVVAQTARLLGLPAVAIFTPEPGGDRLAVRASHGLPEDEQHVFDADATLSGQVFRRHKAVQVAVGDERTPAATTDLGRRYGLTNVVAVPLLVHNQTVGVLTAGRADGRPFDDGEIRLLETLCAHAAAAIDSARLLERVTESEAKYRTIVENAQAAVIVVDAYRQVIFWNRGAQRLFGWKATEVEGHHVEFIYPEDRRADVVEHILPVLQREGVWSGEFPLVRKNGETFTGFLSLSRVFDARGSVICTLGILSDITERVRLREQLVQAQKMETLGALAGGIAHDFNNLLTAVLGSANLLEDDLPKDSENYDAAVSIEKAARRGADLVAQLMALSRRQPTRSEPVDLNQLVAEAVDLAQRTFPGRIDVTTRLEPHLRSVRGDPSQMHQVLMNLLVNARDAMGQGGTLTVATENVELDGNGSLGPAFRPGPGVMVTVSDTGCGIAPEDQGRIFEPFYTTKAEGGGTGLGLSTTYAIVNRHGGRIAFESEPGRGTTFRVLLPAG